MKYYAERNCLLDDNFDITIRVLREAFWGIYKYCKNKNYFDVAFNGVWAYKGDPGEKQEMPPLLSPTPEVFFLVNLHSENIYPIELYYENYTKEQLFTVIEVLYNNIGVYDCGRFEQDDAKEDFATHINNILRFYGEGYYLEPNMGFISKGINEPVKHMLSEDLSNVIEDSILANMRSAVKLYYGFDSTLDVKRKAIAMLADILEPLREELKTMFACGSTKNGTKHDNSIFQIVNAFNIRHNKSNQKTEYNHEIWYDWMFHYYTSVIITYYKLKQAEILDSLL